MIVSILQRMGFPMGKPVHSRAGEAPQGSASGTRGGVVTVAEQAQGSSARRQEVKSKSGNSILAKDVKSNVKAVAQPKGKPAAKPAKVVAKPATKTAVKSVSPSAAKTPVAKKPATKVQPVPKPAVKAPTKAPVSAAKKVAQPVAKPAKQAIKPTPKSVAKAAAKPAAGAAASKVKNPVQETPVVAKATPASVAPLSAAVVVKAGRPSSRLAQLTVPSMAQAVASTAAKASYTQTMPTSVIVPVLPSSIKKDPALANNWKTKPVAELSDAELMAMPDAEYMNEVQMAAFRLKLVTLKRDILSNAGETTEHLREDTSVVPDPADRATIEEEHALELRTRDRERKLLKKIEQSIARIDAGDYGYCDETGEPIGVGRLLARPTATLSLEAQQRRELKQKMFGD